jgi:hypothetical protein
VVFIDRLRVIEHTLSARREYMLVSSELTSSK